ncbi:MAG: hypothetical protein ACYDA6_01450 [Solirubrobacteraceae bacterium]
MSGIPKSPRAVPATVAAFAALAVWIGAAGAGAAAGPTAIEFFARTPHGKASCGVSDLFGASAQAFCEAYRSGRQSKATVNARGEVSICIAHDPRTNRCDLGNAGVNTPTFGYGHAVTVGRFRCVVSHRGVVCTVHSTGIGFRFTPSRAVRIGPVAKGGRA